LLDKKRATRRLSLEQRFKKNLLASLENQTSKSPKRVRIKKTKPKEKIKSPGVFDDEPIETKEQKQEQEELSKSVDLIEFEESEEEDPQKPFITKILMPELFTQRTDGSKESQEEEKEEYGEDEELFSISRFDRILEQSSW